MLFTKAIKMIFCVIPSSLFVRRALFANGALHSPTPCRGPSTPRTPLFDVTGNPFSRRSSPGRLGVRQRVRLPLPAAASGPAVMGDKRATQQPQLLLERFPFFFPPYFSRSHNFSHHFLSVLFVEIRPMTLRAPNI